MASIQSIAITKDQAYASLKDTTAKLAEHFGIEAPDLDIHKRHPLEYRNAQELHRMAMFLEDIVEKMDENEALLEVKALVSQADNKWTKAQVKELVGVHDG